MGCTISTGVMPVKNIIELTEHCNSCNSSFSSISSLSFNSMLRVPVIIVYNDVIIPPSALSLSNVKDCDSINKETFCKIMGYV